MPKIVREDDNFSSFIWKDLPLEALAFVHENYFSDEMTVDEAKASGAIGLFESKYGSKVKVYTVPGFSREICGGPHAVRTGELGHFEIKKEEASSAGVRRIKAVLIHG